MKIRLSKTAAGVAAIALVAVNSWAEGASIVNVQALSFGAFAAGGGGSVTVSPSGARSASGTVRLMPSSEGGPAQFTVSGDPYLTYTIQLPDNDFVSLTGPGGSMLIDSFTSVPYGADGQLDSSGSQTLTVGGTLNVETNQVPGSYSGSFTVIINYQ